MRLRRLSRTSVSLSLGQQVQTPRPAASPILMNVWRPRPRRPTVPKFAHDLALHYLAGRQEYELPHGVRHWLTQVVEGYTGRCDEGAARRGIEWMRDKARARGETPPL
jgi:hypothetical protein